MMLQLARGQKQKLAALTPALKLQARLEMTARTLNFDLSCFGLDENSQLSDDRYFVFFNQRQSPQNEIALTSLSPHAARFEVDLARLPPAVRRLVFVATVDGAGQMNDLDAGRFVLSAGGQDVGEFAFSGGDFSVEKAVMVSEIYFKGEWRVAANGQGFTDGIERGFEAFRRAGNREKPGGLGGAITTNRSGSFAAASTCASTCASTRRPNHEFLLGLRKVIDVA